MLPTSTPRIRSALGGTQSEPVTVWLLATVTDASNWNTSLA
jgi:hypothetical protein